MIIENLDLFKAWLTGCLQPLCDADPGALAKYVIALVKKDKPEAELKALCLDQLEVFFQKETKPFVELLFETLNSKSYLKQQLQPVQVQPLQVVQPPAPPIQQRPPVAPTTSNASNIQTTVGLQATDKQTNEASVNGTATIAIAKDVASSLAKVTTVLPSKSDSKRLDAVSDGEDRDTKRNRQQRSKSRSRSPVGRGGARSKGDSRDSDDRRNRRFLDEDRRRRGFVNRRYDNRYRDFRDRDRRSQEGMDRERDRDNRSSQRKERRDKSSIADSDRSKRDSWSRSWSRSLSRSPSRSRSRSWSRVRERTRETNRNEARNEPRSTLAVPTNNSSSNVNTMVVNSTTSTVPSAPPPLPPALPLTGDHGDKDYRLSAAGVPPLPPSIPQDTNSVDGNHFRNKAAKRCRDYDEKGYCMSGDRCPYDHGTDPVVVEDVSVLGFSHSSNVPPPHGGVPPGPAPPPPPPGTLAPILPPIINQSMATGQLPPLPPEPYMPEPYNPEAPGMERGPPRMRSSFWHPGGQPQGPPPSIRPPLPHQRGPPPHLFHSGPPPRTRELIGVPTIDEPPERIESPTPKSVICQRIVLGPQQSQPQHLLMEPEGNGSLLPPDGPMQTPSNNPGSVLMGRPIAGSVDAFRDSFKRGPCGRPFDYNRLGPRKPFNPDRCILELRKVPRTLNTIAQLNTHFSKFGTVVNLQVCFAGDPEAALVQFSSHAEANAAYRCTEAVMNNRFIKVFWHNKENLANNNTLQPQPQVSQPDSAQQTVPEPSSPTKETNNLPPITLEVSSVKPSVKERLGNTTPNKINHFKKLNKILVNNASTHEVTTEKAVLFSPTGNLSRTVFNPAALKKTNIGAGGPRKLKEDHKKETIKKKMEVQKKRQHFIQTHVKQQKALFDKLEKCKTDKEKQEIKQMLVVLSKTIEQLRSDIKKDASEIVDMTKSITPAVPKSKAEAEKELLDAEMDLYNKQHRGDDITDLKKKVNDLKQQARALGLLDSSGHLRSLRGGLSFRSRGNFIQRGGSISRRGGSLLFRGPAGLTSVDRRPRKILAEGATETERENLYVHFSQFAEIEGIEILTNGIVFTFKNRKDAEKAMAFAGRLNQPEFQQLKTSWFRSPPSLSEDILLDAEENVLHTIEDVGDHLEDEEDLLMGDDEEEEDSEARSWRR